MTQKVSNGQSNEGAPNPLERRRLGRTALEVSAIGFGGGGIGREYGETDEAAGVAAVRSALDAGVNFFDVAPSYGNGTAESVLGTGLRGRRQDAVVMTKVDLLPAGRDQIAAFTRASVFKSLERLQTDYIDVLLVHNAITSQRSRPYEWSVELDDAYRMADEFEVLQAAGVIRHTGFSAWRCTPNALDDLFRSDRFDCIQAEYNMLNRSAVDSPPSGSDLGDMAALEVDHDEVAMSAYDYRGTDQYLAIARAKRLDLGTIAIRPLMGGVLADHLDREAPMGSDLHRMWQRAEPARTLLHAHDVRLSQVAVRFALARSEIDTVILGFKNSSEVWDAVEAATTAHVDTTAVKEAERLTGTSPASPEVADDLGSL